MEEPTHFLCGRCKVEKDGSEKTAYGTGVSFQCKACNSLVSRLNRMVAKNDLQEEWKGIDQESRARFMADCSGKFGNCLKLAVKETIEECKVTEDKDLFINDGHYSDEVDLNIKYEKKPKQLESILENARTVFCPIRKVKLYEDPDYNSKASQGQTTTTVEKRSCQRESAIKPQKKPKVEKPPAAEGVVQAEGCQPGLKKNQIVRIGKLIEKLTKAKEDLDQTLEKAKNPFMADFIPPITIKKADAASKLVDAQKAGLELAVENGRAAFDEVNGEALAALKEANKLNSYLVGCLEDAAVHCAA